MDTSQRSFITHILTPVRHLRLPLNDVHFVLNRCIAALLDPSVDVRFAGTTDTGATVERDFISMLTGDLQNCLIRWLFVNLIVDLN